MSEEGVFVRAARGAGALGVQNAVNALLGLMFFMFFARLVSVGEMGVYGAASLVMSVLVIVGNFGFGFAASHFIPFYQGRSDVGKVLAVSKLIVVLTTVFGGILFAASFLLADYFSLLLLGASGYNLVFKGCLLLFLLVC